MSFDKPTRNLLAKMTAAARDRLAEDIAAQLQTSYGLYPDGSRLDVAQLPEDRHAAAELRALLDHFESAEPEGKQRKSNAYQRLVREMGFTLLNRLAALRLCEERGLVIECVRAGMNSAGFQLYDRLAGGALGNRYQTYRAFLACMFDELAADLGALFDRSTPQSAVFPSEPALNDVLALLNDPELTSRKTWQQDETIGWIYQYYNDPAERKKMRDESQAPRNSRELAVRNQFFTPRYVVEFLTDNTLGRTWYEMRQGETKLTEQCRYLVQRKHPIFLTEGQDNLRQWSKDHASQRSLEESNQMWVQPDPDIQDIPLIFDYALTVYADAYAPDNLGEPLYNLADRIESRYSETGKWEGSFEELRCVLGFEQGRWQHYGTWPEGKDAEIIQELYRAICEQWDREVDMITFRAKKDPRRLRVLDPACGSGHFLLYAFDLLETIYDEAYDDPNLDAELREAFPDRADFIHQVPRLILENNLYGIDIDPRAAQIAALALWLRAQRDWQAQKLGGAERPRIGRTHIVVAEPMPGDEGMLEEFIADLPKDQHPEIISPLVRIVFEKMKLAGEAGSLLKIEEELKEAIEQARTAWDHEPQPEQLSFLPSQPKPKQLGLDLSGVTDESFWQRVEELVLRVLEGYARQAENGKGVRRRLFVGDAAQGFAFIDICKKRYDVVLMNPPFGSCPTNSLKYIRSKYTNGYVDLFSACIDRGRTLNDLKGVVGAITSRTGFFLSSFQAWRKKTLLGDSQIQVCLDLGQGVLDGAMVETAAYTVGNRLPEKPAVFLKLPPDGIPDRTMKISAQSSYQIFTCRVEKFLGMPTTTISYELVFGLANDFLLFPTLSSVGGIYRGSATGDDERFIRAAWEIDSALLAPSRQRRWRWLSKGGDFGAFYYSLHLVIDWLNDGDYLGEFMYEKRPRNGYLWGPKSWSKNFIGKSGVFWPLRSQKGVSFRILPSDCAFSHKSPIVTSGDENTDFALLAILNSLRIQNLADSLTTFGAYEMGVIGSLPIDTSNMLHFTHLGIKGYETAKQAYCLSEQDPNHILLCNKEYVTLSKCLEAHRETISLFQNTFDEVLSEINRAYCGGTITIDKRHLVEFQSLSDEIGIEAVISEFVGFLFGRWDIRLAIDSSLFPKPQMPFEPLPVCQPALLIDLNGLPSKSGNIVSREWLRNRPSAITIPSTNEGGIIIDENGEEISVLIKDDEYPISIPWNGIVVDDPGLGDHPEPNEWDIIRNIDRVIQTIWPGKGESIAIEACELSNVKDLREYFRKPAGFFSDHLKRYSKSRRQAPIYWPLSTPSGSYTLWIYYQRLTSETLYMAVNRFVSPKIEQVERYLGKLEDDLAKVFGRSAGELRDKVDATRAFLAELNEFRSELLRVANLPYQPDLNDGVIINAAPLYKLFRLTKWSKDCQTVWEKLEDGEYDWSHMAYVLWPDRVREMCKSDKSLAIAHGLEELLKDEVKGKKGKRKIDVSEEQKNFGF